MAENGHNKKPQRGQGYGPAAYGASRNDSAAQAFDILGLDDPIPRARRALGGEASSSAAPDAHPGHDEQWHCDNSDDDYRPHGREPSSPGAPEHSGTPAIPTQPRAGSPE